jgi:hypothetical protein
MNYEDFVCKLNIFDYVKSKIFFYTIVFVLSEEDKTTNTSIEYWFKILDLDQNGIITYTK